MAKFAAIGAAFIVGTFVGMLVIGWFIPYPFDNYLGMAVGIAAAVLTSRNIEQGEEAKRLKERTCTSCRKKILQLAVECPYCGEQVRENTHLREVTQEPVTVGRN